VTGKIHRGVIHRDDVVTINGATYKVTLIDVIPNQVEYAKEGANVGLHLSTMNTNLFKRGDVVTAKKFEPAPPKNTFICDVCKKELPIKYRHNGNTCVECAQARKEQDSQPRASAQKDEFCLGTFNFTEEDRQPLKNAARRYMPSALDTIEAQLTLLKTLSLVMEVSVVELKTEFSWKIPDAMPEEIKKERFTSALVAETSSAAFI
jgi:selenocysteine-specific translation elongation factor